MLVASKCFFLLLPASKCLSTFCQATCRYDDVLIIYIYVYMQFHESTPTKSLLLDVDGILACMQLLFSCAIVQGMVNATFWVDSTSNTMQSALYQAHLLGLATSTACVHQQRR
jgi:hypothetical protein